MAVVMTVTILAGFSNTYLPRLAGGQPVLGIVHLHALVFTSWLAPSGRSARASSAPRTAGVEFPDPEGFLLLNVAAASVFAILVGAGWFFRRDPQTHKRLMVMATAGILIGPGVSRLPFASGRPAVIGVLAMAFAATPPIVTAARRHRRLAQHRPAAPALSRARPSRPGPRRRGLCALGCLGVG